MAIKYTKLVEQFRADPDAAGRNLRESLEAKDIRPDQFEFGQLFEAFFGRDEFVACKKEMQLANQVFTRHLSETTGAVNTSSFLNITGQIVYSALLEKYQVEDFRFTKLIPTVQTQFLEGEKIAGIPNLADENTVRNEGDPYKLAGMGEDFIFTPPLKDRGQIIPLTWEAVFSDRTGSVLQTAGEIGTTLGQNKEKRAIDCVIDENTTAHRYNWRGTVIASYGNNSGSHTWDNLEASNALLDWTDVDAADQLFNGMTDPYTGEPLMIEAKHLIVTKQLEKVAMRIRNATEVRVATPGFATTGNPNVALQSNPYASAFDVVSTRLLASRLATDTTWFYGDVTKYAKYMQAEPLTVLQAPPNNEDEFNRRIVAKYRTNERGAYVVVNPRYLVTCTA